MPPLIAVLLAASLAPALGGAPAPAVIVRVNDGVQAYVVEEGVVYWVSGNVLRAQTVGGAEPRDLAVLARSRVATTLVVDGADVLVGAMGGTERSLHRVPRAGGEPLLVSDEGGPDVVRHGDQVRWIEVLGKTTSGIAGRWHAPRERFAAPEPDRVSGEQTPNEPGWRPSQADPEVVDTHRPVPIATFSTAPISTAPIPISLPARVRAGFVAGSVTGEGMATTLMACAAPSCRCRARRPRPYHPAQACLRSGSGRR